MTISKNSKVGEVVKLNYNTAPLFHANRIDYCCGGSKSILEACNEVGIEPNQLITQLEEISDHVDPDSEYINNLALDELSEYIVNRHHSYVAKNIPFLKESLEKICDVHGENHPELLTIRDLFFESADALKMHMQKEELVLFPYIQKMMKVDNSNNQISGANFGSVSNPIGMMITEHETEGKRFDTISKITRNYTIPDDACTTYSATLDRLKDFENDLHRHIHLENNILFPKAIELENELTK